MPLSSGWREFKNLYTEYDIRAFLSFYTATHSSTELNTCMYVNSAHCELGHYIFLENNGKQNRLDPFFPGP